MAKKFIFFHVLPFLFACLTVLASVLLIETPERETVTISGKQTVLRGKYGNLTEGQSAEIEFIGSLQNKQQLTIFGSSEFTQSPICSYYFFPDSLGVQMLGMGHAFHQSLGMLIELMAADEYIDSLNTMYFIISPGWFAQPGTNTEAFLEFARPNFFKENSRQSKHP